MFTDDELIKKKDIFDPIEDDDDIDWKYNPFDVDSIDEVIETPEQLMSQMSQITLRLWYWNSLMHSLLRFVANRQQLNQ